MFLFYGIILFKYLRILFITVCKTDVAEKCIFFSSGSASGYLRSVLRQSICVTGMATDGSASEAQTTDACMSHALDVHMSRQPPDGRRIAPTRRRDAPGETSEGTQIS